MSKSARMGMAGVATGWSISVAGALAVLSSCGKVADVLDAPSAGGSASRGPGPGATGTPVAPEPPTVADASAGNTGTSAPAVPPGSGGMAPAPPSAGGNPGSSFVDPHAADRRSMVEKYCAACDSRPDCVPKMITETTSWLSDGCWDQWVTAMNCSMTSGCSPISGGTAGMGACLAERTALDSCIIGQDDHGGVMGVSGSCSWYRSASGLECQIACSGNLERFYDALCDGPPNGPFACSCRLNGRNLLDSLVSNAPWFYGDTCQDAAQLMADGYCQKIISCCYAYRGPRFGGEADTDLCECTSDPSAGGFASCAALAASKKDGKIVDLCPAYSYPFSP